VGLAADRAHVRLAELVAALSLGVDLGFGQPSEHILRQCLIALRLAERIGLSEEDRGAVYYSALLVNVGCHSHAYEQARWFGDDIALKSTKFDHVVEGDYGRDMRSLRAAVASLRLIGSGNPPLHRLRVGLQFAVSGHRDIDRMIESHSLLARRLAEQLGLPDPVREAVAAAYEQWDGRGGRASSPGRPCRWARGSRKSPSSPRWHTGLLRPPWRLFRPAAGPSLTRR
jgi:hypothetical protein